MYTLSKQEQAIDSGTHIHRVPFDVTRFLGMGPKGVHRLPRDRKLSRVGVQSRGQ